MKTTSVSAAKNGLSALLDRVKAGEAVLITERGVPIARIEPVMTPHDPTGRQQRLSRAGLLDPGSGALGQAFYAGPATRAPRGHSLVDSVLDERRTGW